MNRPDESPKNPIIIYTAEDGLTKIDTTFDGDTVWLSIDQMAELFQRDKSTISRHIKNIFTEGELNRDSVVAKFATTAADGKTYQVEFYNLDVIISVGYRVKSKRGTQFRIWATGILKEYMRKGFALDDERLKNLGGGGYFKELTQAAWNLCFSTPASLPYLVREYGATKYPKELLSLLKIIYFDALKLKIAKERNLTFPGSVSDNENVIKLAGQYRKGELLKAINVLSDGERQLYFNGSFAQILEISLSKILAGNRG